MIGDEAQIPTKRSADASGASGSIYNNDRLMSRLTSGLFASWHYTNIGHGADANNQHLPGDSDTLAASVMSIRTEFRAGYTGGDLSGPLAEWLVDFTGPHTRNDITDNVMDMAMWRALG